MAGEIAGKEIVAAKPGQQHLDASGRGGGPERIADATVGVGRHIGILPGLPQKLATRLRGHVNERRLQAPLLDYRPAVDGLVARTAGKCHRERVHRLAPACRANRLRGARNRRRIDAAAEHHADGILVAHPAIDRAQEDLAEVFRVILVAGIPDARVGIEIPIAARTRAVAGDLERVRRRQAFARRPRAFRSRSQECRSDTRRSSLR